MPGNYLPYYEAVVRSHSNVPNDYWVHFFVSKGNGLGLVSNILSDVQGAALASYLILLVGAIMVWRLASVGSSAARAIGLVGVCLYLQFYAGQDAFAKPHIIRNTFILYLILSFARLTFLGIRDESENRVARGLIIAAVVVLSPLAIGVLIPILLIETLVIALPRRPADARRSLFFPAWALAATAVVCAYNFVEVGLPELHAMPTVVGRFANIERFGRWVDPRLAYADDRLTFLQVALPSGLIPHARAGLSVTLSAAQVLRQLVRPSVVVFVVGGIVVGAFGFGASRWSGVPSRSNERDHASPPGERAGGTIAAAAYLVTILAIVAGLHAFGGEPGSSMERFTGFANPVAIALGIVILTGTWGLAMSPGARAVVATGISGVACAAMLVDYPAFAALPWRSSLGFLIGKNTYADMNDYPWETVAASRVASALPAHERVELLNFLPGFTAVPNTPFQRPDGCVYIRDYTKVLYGSEDQAARIYSAANVNYFLADVSSVSPLVWSAFSSIFSPQSIRSRMRLVTHEKSDRLDLYLLTWNQAGTPAADARFETFLQKWTDKLASERKNGYYHARFENGARFLGHQVNPDTPIPRS